MKTGISKNSIIPIRQKPSEKSEQVSQLLFGEEFEIMQKRGGWYYIRSLQDNYEGWIDKSTAGIITESSNKKSSINEKLVLQELFSRIETPDKTVIYAPAGSIVPKPDKNGNFKIDNDYYKLLTIPQKQENELIKTAQKFINIPYIWGGKSSFGLDCSGFIQTVFRMHGTELPRDASEQVKMGKTICFRHDAVAGNIAFFEDEKKNITHTGIIIDNTNIIHASGKVRIDIMDHSGIYNTDLKKYTHTLSVIKEI